MRNKLGSMFEALSHIDTHFACVHIIKCSIIVFTVATVIIIAVVIMVLEMMSVKV